MLPLAGAPSDTEADGATNRGGGATS
jgi:hypothetical protein